MPSASAEGITAAIKRAVNIVDLIGEQVSLTRRGRTFKGLCPFHDDHNPSLTVDPERQFYKCFSCGAGGDVFDFVMNRERVGFREALELLAQRARIELPKHRSRRSSEERGAVEEIQKWAESEFHKCLIESEVGAPARDYAVRRGINRESIESFSIGYAPHEWDWLIQRARVRRITPEALEKCGLVRKRTQGPGYRDWFRGRLMFPIRDARGRTIAFGGRILPQFEDQESIKYNNTPAPIFIKSEHLYGLDRAREAISKSRVAVVVEGYTDCIMAHQFGLTHVVGTLGTALSAQHISTLKRFADRIVLVYDGDEPGQKAADRALGLILSCEVDLRVLSLPDNLDPCEYLLERGVDDFRRGLDKAEDALDFKLRRSSQQYDLTSISGRRQALDFVLAAVAAVPIASSGTSAATRDIVLDRLGQRLGIPADTVRRRLREVRDQSRAQNRRQNDAEQTKSGAAEDVPAERELLEVLLAEPTLLDSALREIALNDITTPAFRRILEVCIELQRDGQVVDLDGVRLRLEDREIACRASTLAETGREKGAVERRLADVLAFLKARKSQVVAQDSIAGGDPEAAQRQFLAHRYERARSRQRMTQRHATFDS